VVPTIVTQIIAGLTQSIRALLQFRAAGRSENPVEVEGASSIPRHLEVEGFAYIPAQICLTPLVPTALQLQLAR
jgi:hypothetical protein